MVQASATAAAEQPCAADAEPVRPFELKPVNADILPVGVVRAVRLAAYYDSFVNEAAAVVPI